MRLYSSRTCDVRYGLYMHLNVELTFIALSPFTRPYMANIALRLQENDNNIRT